MKTIVLQITLVLMLSAASVSLAQTKTATGVIYRGNPASAISSSVTIPEGKKYFYSSGTLGPVVDSTAAPGTRGRYGDTKTQAI